MSFNKSIIAGLLTQLSRGWKRKLDPLPWHLHLLRRQLPSFLVSFEVVADVFLMMLLMMMLMMMMMLLMLLMVLDPPPLHLHLLS